MHIHEETHKYLNANITGIRNRKLDAFGLL